MIFGNCLSKRITISLYRNRGLARRCDVLSERSPGVTAEAPARSQRMPDGSERVALVKSDFVSEGVELEFELMLLPHKEITPKVVRTVLEYGRFCGLGQARGDGWGRFKVIAYDD